jgi:TPR repeat protein
MAKQADPDLAYARARAYGSSDPFWWSNLGAAYATCRRPDLKRARWWYRRAARAGHVRAWFEYGLMLIDGEGGPKRPAQGRRLLEQAAASHEIDALRVLSAAYADGTYTFRPSKAKAAATRRALRRELAQLRKETSM